MARDVTFPEPETLSEVLEEVAGEEGQLTLFQLWREKLVSASPDAKSLLPTPHSIASALALRRARPLLIFGFSAPLRMSCSVGARSSSSSTSWPVPTRSSAAIMSS